MIIQKGRKRNAKAEYQKNAVVFQINALNLILFFK